MQESGNVSSREVQSLTKVGKSASFETLVKFRFDTAENEPAEVETVILLANLMN